MAKKTEISCLIFNYMAVEFMSFNIDNLLNVFLSE